MKKILSVIIILAMLLILVSCKEKYYDPVESTEEEATTVMTMTVGETAYEIKYELFRALFLTHKSAIDGGDESVWVGEERDEYIAAADALVISYIAEIYSVFEAARRAGLDVFSEDVENQIREYVKISVEGGSISGVDYPGYPSYDDYLAALRALNINYSVQALMLRYSIAIDMLEEHYIGTIVDNSLMGGTINEGEFTYTEADVKAFYESDECVRVLRTFVIASMSSMPRAQAERMRAAIAEAARLGGEDRVRDAMIGAGSTTAEAELAEGYLMARHNLSRLNYGDMVDAAFELGVGGVSPVVKASEGNEIYYYVIYRAEKTEEYYNNNSASIAYIYLKNRLGAILDEIKGELVAGTKKTEYLGTLDYSKISMK